jgi:tRNA pseudouridine55 synthase
LHIKKVVQQVKTYNFPEGEILLIDKPSKWTSFDAVNKIRYMFNRHLGIKKIKVGHAGTLDPLATGLLLICVGKATKQIYQFAGLDKEYTGTFYIGATTPSLDEETEVDQEFETNHIKEKDILDTTQTFLGPIMQTPPAYSAIKVDGTRAYRLARGNEKVVIPPREVVIHEFEITETGIPETSFRVLCSKGTYIRTLANDFGKALGSGAYLKTLRRTRIGEYHIDDAISIADFEKTLIHIARNS